MPNLLTRAGAAWEGMLKGWSFGGNSTGGAVQTPVWFGDNRNRGMSGNGGASWGGDGGSPSINYAAKVGALWKNTSIYTPISWIRRNFPDAPVMVGERGGEGGDQQHPMALLIAKPNPYTSYSTLAAATIFSYVADGNAYWIKVRDGYGRVVQLWWRPQWTMRPVREPKSPNWIDYYAYKADANTPTIHLPTSDVVHFRNGIDPENELLGMSDLRFLLMSVYTEQEAQRFLASLLTNLGIPGAIFLHKPPLLDESTGETGKLTKDAADAIKANYEEKFTGDKVGRAMVLDGEFDVKFPSIAIDAEFIERAKDISQADIAAAIGIPAVVLGWNVGLKHATAKASHEDSRKQAYRECLMPMQRSMAEDLDLQLLPDFADIRKFRTLFDYSGVATLSEDQNEKAKRWSGLYVAGIAKRGEAREAVNLPATPEDDVYAMEPGKPEDDPLESDKTKTDTTDNTRDGENDSDGSGSGKNDDDE